MLNTAHIFHYGYTCHLHSSVREIVQFLVIILFGDQRQSVKRLVTENVLWRCLTKLTQSQGQPRSRMYASIFHFLSVNQKRCHTSNNLNHKLFLFLSSCCMFRLLLAFSKRPIKRKSPASSASSVTFYPSSRLFKFQFLAFGIVPLTSDQSNIKKKNSTSMVGYHRQQKFPNFFLIKKMFLSRESDRHIMSDVEGAFSPRFQKTTHQWRRIELKCVL